jgi:hypothetical protein
MPKQRPTIISRNAFFFCRYFVAVLLIIALIFKLELLVWIVFAILALSAISGVKRAPLIFIYTIFEKIFKIKPKFEVVDINAMRFAHTLGSILAGSCLVLFLVGSSFAWGLVFVFTILKVISATGFCPASKLYTCSTSGNCCKFLKHK